MATKLPIPRSLNQLATRQELTSWLTRQFIYIIRPGRADSQPRRIILPNNLVAFIGLLIHLHGVGYPGHWLTEFLQPILADNLVTNIPPYLDVFPIPVSEIRRRVPKRKVRLDPWLPDLENILAPTWRGLPFAIVLPSEFAKTEEEIGTYSTKCKINNPMLDVFHPGDPTIVLVFFKAVYGVSEYTIAGTIPELFEGKDYPTVGNIFILTMQEAVDQRKEIRWKMSRKRAAEMMQDKWFMVAVRSDMHLPGSWSIQRILSSRSKLVLCRNSHISSAVHPMARGRLRDKHGCNAFNGNTEPIWEPCTLLNLYISLMCKMIHTWYRARYTGSGYLTLAPPVNRCFS